MRFFLLPLFCGVLLVAGCSGPDLLNALTSSGGYTVTKGVAYGAGPRRLLDVYQPEGADPAATPTVVFFYGGSWQSGDRGDYVFVGQALAARGYRVVVPDYRLFPEVRYPAFLEDSAAAVRWTLQRFGDDGPVFLMGHSAGAYNAAMLALEPRWLGADMRDRIAGVANLAGPYDFLPLRDANLKTIFGPEETRPRTQPINYVDGAAPPMLLITGEADDTVLPRNTRRLAAAIQDAGGVAETRFYDGVGHSSLIGAIARPLRFWAPTLQDVDAFFRGRMAVAFSADRAASG